MAGPTTAARAELAGVLAPVWPGRVQRWWPTAPRPVAGVYIAESSGAFDVDDLGVPAWAATFRVRLVADGADQAAVAALDDLLDQTYRAVAGSEDFYPDGYTFDPVDIDQSTELPAYTFTVRCWLDVATWCAVDDADAVTIPPDPIGV